ncbi:MAG: helix-turn-helix domain-containing protein [Oscillospiraceae bacterium]|nr:helix-turn-helix domain-containing protein [Oscillospiraceae bacterium]
MNDFENKIPDRLVLLRKKHQLSQYELAEKLGFSRSLIANYEQGRREPDCKTLLIFASFYNVSVDFLFGRVDSESDIFITDSVASLSDESMGDLQKYIKLLKIRDYYLNKKKKGT